MARKQREVVARVEADLLDDIVAGRLPVGARLPPEASAWPRHYQHSGG
jgi:DNA-binding FadR family transcriptional regulator